MNTIHLPLFGRQRHAKQLARYKQSELIINQAHAVKMASIANADEKAHNLRQVLERNHISIQINNATGKKYEPNTRTDSSTL